MMRWGWFIAMVAVLLFTALPSIGKKKKKDTGPGFATEQALTDALITCLRNQDAGCYSNLFPEIELLSKQILANASLESQAFQLVKKFQNDTLAGMQTDSLVQAALRDDFDRLMREGERYNLHWNSIILQRFQLEKKRRTRDTVLEKIVPERFFGDIFFADALTGISYAIRISDMNKIGDRWYGGQVLHVFPVDNKDDLLMLLELEAIKAMRLKNGDSSMLLQNPFDKKQPSDTGEVEENLKPISKKEVASRRYFRGFFDDEIPVMIYLRGLKGDCGETECSYDGLMKFADQEDYIPLRISKTKEGNWQLAEEPLLGVMDVDIKDGVLTGTWTSISDKTSYDIRLEQSEPSAKRIANLDKTMRQLEE